MVGTPENGSGATCVRSVFILRILWVSCQSWQSHFTATTTLSLIYQVPVIVLRDGVELNSFAVKLRFHRLPVYPAGVRGVDLSSKGADVG